MFRYFLGKYAMNFASFRFCDGKQFTPVHIKQVLMSVADSECRRNTRDFVPNEPSVQFVSQFFGEALCLKQVFVYRPQKKHAVFFA